MVFHLRSLTHRNVCFLDITKRLRSTRLISSSSDSSKIGHQEERDVGSGTDSELGVIVANLQAGSSDEEVFQSLLGNPTCDALQLTHHLFDKLLFRLKDDWKSALGVFRWAQSRPDYEPLPEFYDRLVDILGKSKQMERMNAFVKEMHEKNVVSVNTVAKVMRRFSGAGEWREAVRMFDELRNYGIEKNTETMNMLLDTLCKEKRVERAREVFLELKLHIPPDAYTFNMFIYGWCKIHRVEEAYWTIQEMKGYGFRPCVISYSTIIQAYCAQSNFSKVYELLEEMQAEGCPPNVVTFTIVLCSLTKSQKYEEALQISERMRSVGCKPDTLFFNALLNTLGRAGHVQQAIRCFKFVMPVNGVNPDTSTYNTLIAMFCHHAQEEKAFKYLRHMETSPYCKPDVNSYNPLLKLNLKAGEFGKCRQMVDDMVNKHHLSLDLATYSLLIHGLCRAKKCEWAYQLFEEMIGKDIRPRYQTCRLLLDEIKQKNMSDAAETIEEYIKRMKSSKRSSM